MISQKHNSLFWSTVLQFANHGFNIVITIVLANILAPKDFGLISMVLVVSEFSRIILEFGFGQALIFKQDANNRDYSTVFWFNVLVGGILTLVVLFSAKYFALFYDQPILKPLAMVLSVNYLLASFSIVPQIILIKKLDFKTLTKIRLVSILISGLCGIWLATSYGIWALVFIEVSRTLLIAIASFILVKEWKLEFIFDWQSFKSLYKFSINVFGNESLNYWMDNFDKLIIGRVLGDISLGLYRQSFSFMLIPVNNISKVMNSVLFPILSTKQEDKKYISNTFFESISIVKLIIFPILTILFITAEPLVDLLLGDDWKGMIIILKYFSIAGIFYALAELMNSFFLSIGETKVLFKANLLNRFILIIAVIFALRFKLEGVALAVLIVSPIKLIITLYSLNKLISINFKLIIRNIFKYFFISILIASAILIFNYNVLFDLESIYKVIFSTLITLILYTIFYYLFFREDLKKFLFHIKMILQRN